MPVREAAMRINGVFTLNDTGATIWKSIAEGMPREQAIESLVSGFNIDEKTATADYDEYVETLIEAGFITK